MACLQKFIGLLGDQNPHFGTTMPRKSKCNSTYMEMGSFPLLAAVSWNSWCALAFSPSDGSRWGRISCSKKLWHIKVTWLPESSRDGIFFLPHPMFILGHVATALCITSILTWAETCWLDIFSIKPFIIPLLFIIVSSIWSGPQTFSPSDWSRSEEPLFFLVMVFCYLF